MISEKLLELAFLYKKTKLWKCLYDTELFAVRLPGGEIGYCSIMGLLGEHCALGLYVGDHGYNSFRIVMHGPEMVSELNYQEWLLSQDCVQCAFEAKDELSDEEAEAVRQYAKAHKISLRGRNAFPHFVKYRPNYLPWFLTDERDQENLCEALAAAIEVAQRLESAEGGKAELGILPVEETSGPVPLLERKNGEFVWSSVPLPEEMPVQYPKPHYVNDIAAAKLKRLKKQGFWECDVLRFPEPMQDSPDQAPYFPVMVMAVSGDTEQVLPPQLSEHYEEKPEDLVDKFAEMFLQQQVRPAILSIRNERTQVLLADFCERAGIRIRMCEELPLLDDAMDSLMDYLGINSSSPDGKLEEMLGMLLQLDDSELGMLPDEIRQQFAGLIEQEILPDELAEELADRLHVSRSQPKTAKTKKTKKTSKRTWIGPQPSYIISVSCGRGCYRHIHISGLHTLGDLHDMIQYAFEFDDDHPYAFFMDNKLWSRRNVYYPEQMVDMTGDGEIAEDCRLCQLKLEAGQQFKYLFDFGDEWVFQCKVLKVLDETIETPAIVRSKGEAPEQY